jgi:hypothetical protein
VGSALTSAAAGPIAPRSLTKIRLLTYKILEPGYVYEQSATLLGCLIRRTWMDESCEEQQKLHTGLLTVDI